MNTSAYKSITRIAMWSGPRNISTALMRAWENRADTFVTDEPFYAYYLTNTDVDHPGRADIIRTQPTQWQEVAHRCTTGTATTETIHYQKHMTQHMLPTIKMDWLEKLVNIFLIRSPQAVASSYAKARPDLTASDLGFEQQHRLYQHVLNHVDSNPLVINSDDVRNHPEQALSAMCRKAGIAFDQAMLTWRKGRRESDGIWAPHWYKNVEDSTGFQPTTATPIELDETQTKIADLCQPYYDEMLSRCQKF
ncbi:hypothetical protein AB833_07705 [Chromatiales bacterium (ex Bugula neritina AB1)]|nr:hypothetical protein AB833_07705 [Chromatiales bacterium (ex Bugula neritina AB1)]